MDKTEVLNVIEGDYGLVSMDPSSIQSILYAKLAEVPVEINVLNTVKSCAFYSATSLKTSNGLIDGFQNIMSHWKSTHNDIDQGLNAKQASETLALINYVAGKLRPVVEFMYWVDHRNFDEFTSQWFMKALPFPFNYSYTKRKKSDATEFIEILYPIDTDMEVIKEFITKTATQCLSTISTRLGKLDFFFGDNPTTLDVVVYGYIAPFIKLPFPSNDIASILSMWPNLTEFVKRIDTKYFPDLKRETKHLPVNEVNRHNEDDVSYMAVFILFVSASSLALGFAIKRGIIQISRDS